MSEKLQSAWVALCKAAGATTPQAQHELHKLASDFADLHCAIHGAMEIQRLQYQERELEYQLERRRGEVATKLLSLESHSTPKRRWEDIQSALTDRDMVFSALKNLGGEDLKQIMRIIRRYLKGVRKEQDGEPARY